MLHMNAVSCAYLQQMFYSLISTVRSAEVMYLWCRFELQISTIRLLDFYGGAADLTPQEYFAAHVPCKVAASQKFES